MSIHTAILDLEALARKAEYAMEKFSSMEVQPTREEYHAFESLDLRFSEMVVKFSEKINCFKDVHADWVVSEGKAFRSRAESARTDLMVGGQPKSLATFKRNLLLVFEGPRDSALDSKSVTSRNKQTRTRCTRIRCLSPSGIITWAAAFPPTLWAAGFMKDLAFDYLVEDMESDQTQAWPVKLREVLHAFGAEEPLKGSSKYLEFIQGKI